MCVNAPAVVFQAAETVVFRDVAAPPPAPGQIQIRTEWSAISAGTESWVLRNRFTWAPTPFPCVPGYQRVGVIAALGEGVEGWTVGERVLATVSESTGAVTAFWGAHAALANSPAGEVYRLPEGLAPAAAATAVVAQVGYNAAYRPTLATGDWVVVMGDGLIGQFGAQAARARGARVILVGRRPERLQHAARHAATHAIAEGPDLVADVRRLTGGAPAAVVIDTIQTPACQQTYLPLLANGQGQIVYSGFSPEDPWARMADLHKRELTTHYIAGWTRSRLDATLVLMARGAIDPEALLTHRVPAARAPAMYRMIHEKTEPFLGILLEW